jgi:hypothetical protein
MASTTAPTPTVIHNARAPYTRSTTSMITALAVSTAPVTFHRNNVSARISVNLSANFSDSSAASR